jgi:hypothetical protein
VEEKSKEMKQLSDLLKNVSIWMIKY